jgi:hypothetical protein
VIKPSRMNENRQNSFSAKTSASRLVAGRNRKDFSSVRGMAMFPLIWSSAATRPRIQTRWSTLSFPPECRRRWDVAVACRRECRAAAVLRPAKRETETTFDLKRYDQCRTLPQDASVPPPIWRSACSSSWKRPGTAFPSPGKSAASITAKPHDRRGRALLELWNSVDMVVADSAGRSRRSHSVESALQ